MRETSGPLPPLTQPAPLRHFLWSRLAGQTAQNALLYGLLIAVVEQTGTALGSTVLVAAFLLPSIVLGVPGGLVADILPKRVVLVSVLLLRALIAGALVWWLDSVFALYLLVLALATVGQVSGPAEAALLPRLLPPPQLARGHAATTFVLIVAQVLGAVVLAPLLIKLAGVRAVCGIAALLFLVAAWQMVRVPRGTDPVGPRSEPLAEGLRRHGVRRRFWQALAVGWRTIVAERTVFRALVRLTLVGTVLKVLIAVAPLLARDVLHIAAENSVFVMAPAAVGSALGLLVAPVLARVLGRNGLSLAGFVLFALGTVTLAGATEIGAWLTRHPSLYIDRMTAVTSVPGVVTVTMLVAVLLGFAFAVTAVAVRTLVNERAPQRLQGRVFATQAAAADLASLVPLLAAGAAADVLGVRPVLFAAGCGCVVVEALLWRSARNRGAAAVPLTP
jgi:MFS family permease